MKKFIVALFLAALTLAPVAAQNGLPGGPGSQIPNSNGGGGGGGGGGVTPVGTFTTGNVVVGAGSTSIRDGASSPLGYLNAPFGLNVANNIAYSGTFGPTQTWFDVQGNTLSGTVGAAAGDGFVSPFHIYIGADTVDTTTTGPGLLLGLSVEHASSTGHTGARYAIQGYEATVGAPASGTGTHVGVVGIGRMFVNQGGASGAYTNYAGGIQGINAATIVNAGATFIANVVAQEMDTTVTATASTAEKHSITIVKAGLDAVQGTFDDSAISFSDQDTVTVPWHYGISFGSYAHKSSFDSTSTLIGLQSRVVPSAVPFAAGIGVDMSGGTFTVAQFKGTGFVVDPAGNVNVAAAGAASASELLLSGTTFTGGTGATTQPSLLVQPSGTTSSAWNTSGTAIGVNMATGFAGRLLDMQVNGASVFSVTPAGVTTSFGGLAVGAAVTVAWNTRGILSSPAVGNIQLGAANSTTVIPQILTAQSAIGTNIAGQNFTVAGSLSTGTGNDGDIIFQTGVKNGASGAVAAIPTTALVIKGETQSVQLPVVAAGTPVASLCLDASNNIIKKTTTGPCL